MNSDTPPPKGGGLFSIPILEVSSDPKSAGAAPACRVEPVRLPPPPKGGGIRRFLSEVVEIGPRIVFARMPPMGTSLQGFVVTVLVLLDEALQADVPADFVAQMVRLEQQQ